jgi:hypothetical protein
MKKAFLTITLSILLGWTIAGNDITPAEAPAGAPAKTFTLKGQVVDFISGESLTGVEVSIEGTDAKAYTDFDGNFEIKEVMPGNYNLIATYISYNNSLVENFKAGENENKVEIKLQASN